MKRYKQKTVVLGRWAILFSADGKLDGYRQHFVYENGVIVTFLSRQKAREYIASRYGYIKGRADLKAEPHCWNYPKVVRVKITYEEHP